MIDRLVFDQVAFPNGAAAFIKNMDVPFTTVYIMLPVGSAHAGIGNIPNGSPHFLEHLLCERTLRNPERCEFEHLVGMTGGWTNAHTSLLWTTYELSVPNRHLAEMLPRFCSVVFEPLLLEEDIVQQRGVISNERQQERWWPGSTEIGNYMRTAWQMDDPVGIKRTFGDDEDLAGMSVESLGLLHRQYFDPRMKIVAVGPGDIAPLLDYVSGLELDTKTLKADYQPVQWIKRDYHEKAFRDAGAYQLNYGAIFNAVPDPENMNVADFILTYLCNSTHGSLYQWLRSEKGWLYDLDWNVTCSPWHSEWSVWLGLSEPAHVAAVREELWERMASALKDTDSLGREIARVRDKAQAFAYQTPDSIIETATQQFRNYGRIVTESESDKYLERCLDGEYIRAAFDRIFSPSVTGSFCAVPIEE